VRGAVIRYARWLRENYQFPIRVPVYLIPSETIDMGDGERSVSCFFAAKERSIEPYALIATGDYRKLLRAWGRDNCLASYLLSLSRQVVRYHRWVETGNCRDPRIAKKAKAMIDAYALTVDHP